MNTQTETTLTARHVTAILKKAGVRKSEEGRNGRIGYATHSYGFTTETNGKTIYTCKLCYGETFHRGNCKATGAARFWYQRKEADGTVTVRLERSFHGFRSGSNDENEKLNRDAQVIESALTEAGLKWVKVKDEYQDKWTVSK